MKTSPPKDLIELVKPRALATILFCDVRSYSKLTEGASIEQLVGNLNLYVSTVVETLKENHGTVAKLVGDALFAYWLAEEQPNHAALACRFAASIPAKLSARSNGFVLSIGIHTGPVAMVRYNVGNNCSPEPKGDVVNTANRLSALCTHYNTQAVASENVIAAAPGVQGWTMLESVHVKGKTEPLTLYGLR